MFWSFFSPLLALLFAIYENRTLQVTRPCCIQAGIPFACVASPRRGSDFYPSKQGKAHSSGGDCYFYHELVSGGRVHYNVPMKIALVYCMHTLAGAMQTGRDFDAI